MILSHATQSAIKEELGEKALTVILESDPTVFFICNHELLLFTVNGKDCEYLLGSDPTHIYVGDEDKEFTCFEDLLKEVSCD
jgi:hypothetical protein